MKNHTTKNVIQAFDILNRSGVSYRLLRNTEDELPSRLKICKDIDVLVNYSNRNKLRKYLVKFGMMPIPHPFRDEVKLYGVHEFDKFEDSNGLLLDINYEIAIRSLDAGQWIPLDQMIQESVWNNPKTITMGCLEIPTLCDEDFFVVTVARCIFDKKMFSAWHQDMLFDLMATINIEGVKKKLALVFYKYTSRLIECISAHDFDGIIEDYLSFKDY